jgi:hypothetical protein
MTGLACLECDTICQLTKGQLLANGDSNVEFQCPKCGYFLYAHLRIVQMYSSARRINELKNLDGLTTMTPQGKPS